MSPNRYITLGMNFANVIATLARRLDARNVHYALIGGFAMALRGVQRATMDLDFLLMLDDLEIAHALEDYLRLFNFENKLAELKSIHGTP